MYVCACIYSYKHRFINSNTLTYKFARTHAFQRILVYLCSHVCTSLHASLHKADVRVRESTHICNHLLKYTYYIHTLASTHKFSSYTLFIWLSKFLVLKYQYVAVFRTYDLCVCTHACVCGVHIMMCVCECGCECVCMCIFMHEWCVLVHYT